MQKFETLTSIATPFPRVNIDTDIIIPAAYLKTTKRTGLGVHAFKTVRYDADGNLVPDNVFDGPEYKGAQILIAGDNFGCGSSREHAPWALSDMGYRVIIAPSFADIFASNCVKNGILTIALKQSLVDPLVGDAEAKQPIAIDLNVQTVTRANGEVIPFDYNGVHRHMMLNGLDEIGQTLESETAIAAFEAKQRLITPWLYRDA